MLLDVGQHLSFQLGYLRLRQGVRLGDHGYNVNLTVQPPHELQVDLPQAAIRRNVDYFFREPITFKLGRVGLHSPSAH